MDAYELMAHDLETRQTARFRKSGKKYNFWNDTRELRIFQHIKLMREISTTYHPDNLR